MKAYRNIRKSEIQRNKQSGSELENIFWTFQLLTCISYFLRWGFPGGLSGKNFACQCRSCRRWRFDPWIRKIPWRRKWQPTPVFLLGESHGQRSLTGYSPKELGTTEATEHTCTFLKIATYCLIRGGKVVTQKSRVWLKDRLFLNHQEYMLI